MSNFQTETPQPERQQGERTEKDALIEFARRIWSEARLTNMGEFIAVWAGNVLPASHVAAPPVQQPDAAPGVPDALREAALRVQQMLDWRKEQGESLAFAIRVRPTIAADIELLVHAVLAAAQPTADTDALRLNWLEHAAAGVHCNFISGPESWTVTIHDVFRGTDTYVHGASIRAAIDAAMQSEGPVQSATQEETS